MNQEPTAQERLDTLVEISGSLLAATTVSDLLQQVVEAAGGLTGARISVAGYNCVNGAFRVVTGVWAADNAPGQPGTAVGAECSAFAMGLLRERRSFRMTDTDLWGHPGWPGLPEGHPRLSGLLGARLTGRRGEPSGLLMVSYKAAGDFTGEDEAQLVQLAALASLGLLHFEARGQADARRQELDRLYAQAGFEQARWQAVVESLPDPVAVCDAQGRATYMNAAYAGLIERSVHPDLPLEEHPTYYQLYWPDGRLMRPEEMPLQQAALQGQAVRGLEAVQISASGRARRLIWNAAPMRGPDGSLIGAVVVGRDVSEQRRMEAEQERLSAESDSILAAIADGLVVYDAAGHIQRLNPMAERLFNYSPAQRRDALDVRAGLAGARGPDGRPYEAEDLPVARALRGATIHAEPAQMHSGDSDRWVAISAAPIIGSNGAPAGAVATFSDITSLHETQERLEQANAALARARDELEGRVAERTAELAQRETLLAETNHALEQSRHELQFLSRGLVEMQEAERRAVARELHDGAGQLLTSLIVGLGILERRFAGSAEARAHIAYLKTTAQEVLEHIHRLGADLRPASLEKLGLGPALRQFVERFGQEAELDVQVELGGLGRGRLPQAVETAIYRIVQEALTNVARHAMAGNVGLVLTFHDGMVTTIVEDDGRGFDPQNPGNEARLGLLAMRQRAEMLGGVLTVESTPGAGTTVFAEIPCCPPVPA